MEKWNNTDFHNFLIIFAQHCRCNFFKNNTRSKASYVISNLSENLVEIFSVQNIASANFQKVCSSTRHSSQTKGGLTCEIVAAEICFLFRLDSSYVVKK